VSAEVVTGPKLELD
jgi:hypothetical protein